MSGGMEYNSYKASAPIEEPDVVFATAQPVDIMSSDTAQQMQQFKQWQQEQEFQKFLAWQQQQQQVSSYQQDSNFSQFQQWQASQQQAQTTPMTNNTPTTNAPYNPYQGEPDQKPAAATSPVYASNQATATSQQTSTQSSQQTAPAPSSNPANDTQASSNTNKASSGGGGFSLFGVIDNATAQVNKINAAQKNTQSKLQNLATAFKNLTSTFGQIFGACNSDACTSLAGKL